MARTKLTRRDGWICLVLTVVTLAVYARLCHAGFVSYDDVEYVAQNARVQSGLNWSNVVWAFATRLMGNWQPLTWFSHMLDCQLFGLDAGRHHLTSVFIHLANTLLLYFLLRGMTGAIWRSALVAALFAWHPLHVESVAWIAERRDVLSTFFLLLTLLAYVRYVEQSEVQSSKSKVPYGLALICFELALMSKTMVVTLPFLLLLLDYWPLKRFAFDAGKTKTKPVARKQLVLEKLPFFALSGLFCWITYMAQAAVGATGALSTLSPGVRTGNALISYSRYLGKIFWPDHLAVLYPYIKSPQAGPVAGAALLIAVITIAAIYLARTRPYFVVGWFWFAGILVPVSGLVPAGLQGMADRYTYVSAVGIFIILIWVAADLANSRPGIKGLVCAAAGLGLAACLMATWIQSGYWQSSESLFRHALATTTGNAVMNYNLGHVLQDEGKTTEAMDYYEESLRLNPAQKLVRNNLGLCLATLGRHAEATNQYVLALQSTPKDWTTHLNYGLSLGAMGDLASAMAEYSNCVRLAPGEAKPHYGLGAILLSQGRFVEAKKQLAEAARLAPGDASAHAQLAVALLSLGETSAAVAEFSTALNISPDDITSLNNLGWILATSQDAGIRNGAEAVRLAERACELTHYQTAGVVGTLAAAYAEAGRYKEAADTGAKACQLALASGDAELAKQSQTQTEFYRAGKPFRESSH